MSLADQMLPINELMDSASNEELNHYCQRYDGFYQYMKLLERYSGPLNPDSNLSYTLVDRRTKNHGKSDTENTCTTV